MPLQPAVQNDRHTGQLITWYYADGVTPKPLTGATITGTITQSGTARAISGVLTVTDGPGGVLSWAYAATDTATAGYATVQFSATYGDGLLDSTFETPWQVLPRP